MKLSEVLPELGGDDRFIVVPRSFAELMGGLEGGAVLAYLVWQQGHTTDECDCFCCTDRDIAEWLHVSLRAVQKARAKLADELGVLGLVEVCQVGNTTRTYYRVELDKEVI